MNVEVLGTIATIFIIIAFCMNNKLYIRLLDIVGACMFVLYGVLINSVSVCILNIVLILINSYKIFIDVIHKCKDKNLKM